MNEKAASILKDFKELAKLQGLLQFPKTKAGTIICDDDIFANFLQSIYESDSLEEFPQRALLRQLRPFTIAELTDAMKKMSNKKAADDSGITLELIKYGPEEFHVHILLLYNEMISKGKTTDQ